MPFQIVGIGEILWDVFPDQDRFGGAHVISRAVPLNLPKRKRKFALLVRLVRTLTGNAGSNHFALAE